MGPEAARLCATFTLTWFEVKRIIPKLLLLLSVASKATQGPVKFILLEAESPMESRLRSSVSLVMFVCWAAWAVMAQQSATAPTGGVSAVVPSMINYTGVLKDETGRTLTSLTGVTFLLYSAEQGGAPLWLETQNVIPDKTGRYTAQL